MIAVVAIDPCHRQPCRHNASWWLAMEADLERLAVETARRDDSYAAAYYLFVEGEQS